ncbi:MAG: hypothetical protein HYW25_04905 [Candidatus Aenigmarchaeota archaeon]|nr:hypothetical protein [Candidatus Aenigmarchaeota archaeon]
MEQLRSYLSREGWIEDWRKTREDVRDEYRSVKRTFGNENGSCGVILAAAVVATPVCAYAGSYFGEGAGYVVGQIIDFLPGVNRVAPWLAEI